MALMLLTGCAGREETPTVETESVISAMEKTAEATGSDAEAAATTGSDAEAASTEDDTSAPGVSTPGEAERDSLFSMNCLGFTQNASKTVVIRSDVDADFSVIDAGTKKSVYDGTFETAVWDEDLKCHVRKGDFSAVHTPGRYYISTQSGDSKEFTIGNDVYQRSIISLKESLTKELKDDELLLLLYSGQYNEELREMVEKLRDSDEKSGFKIFTMIKAYWIYRSDDDGFSDSCREKALEDWAELDKSDDTYLMAAVSMYLERVISWGQLSEALTTPVDDDMLQLCTLFELCASGKDKSATSETLKGLEESAAEMIESYEGKSADELLSQAVYMTFMYSLKKNDEYLDHRDMIINYLAGENKDDKAYFTDKGCEADMDVRFLFVLSTSGR